MAPVSCVSVASCFPTFLSQSQMLLCPRRLSLVHTLIPEFTHTHTLICRPQYTHTHTPAPPSKPHLLLPDAAVSQQPVGFISTAAICSRGGKERSIPVCSKHTPLIKTHTHTHTVAALFVASRRPAVLRGGWRGGVSLPPWDPAEKSRV